MFSSQSPWVKQPAPLLLGQLHHQIILQILELPIKSPAVHPVFGPVFTPYPLFQWYPQSNEILLNLSMKCRNSAFNAERWRVIVVVVQVGAVSALSKKASQDETVGKASLGPSYFAL
jgi:hypothetical protein